MRSDEYYCKESLKMVGPTRGPPCSSKNTCVLMTSLSSAQHKLLWHWMSDHPKRDYPWPNLSVIISGCQYSVHDGEINVEMFFFFKESGSRSMDFVDCLVHITLFFTVHDPGVSPTQVLQIAQGLFYPIPVWAIHHLQQICHPQTETTQTHPEKSARLTCHSCYFSFIASQKAPAELHHLVPRCSS